MRPFERLKNTLYDLFRRVCAQALRIGNSRHACGKSTTVKSREAVSVQIKVDVNGASRSVSDFQNLLHMLSSCHNLIT
jgi:hypothetical protein